MGKIITDQPVMRISDDGAQEWYLNDKLHHTDGPAVIEGDYQEWWLNGKLHRNDGPAIIDCDYQAWCLNGKLHRTDGPAVIDGDRQEWRLNGIKYQIKEWLEKLKATQEEKTLLRLKWAK